MSNKFNCVVEGNKFSFEDLLVYRRSLDFAIKLSKKASDFPIKFSRIRDQLIGATISIPLNIAEGTGRKTPKDQFNFYKIARASAFECVPILEICLGLNLIVNNEYKYFKNETTEICKMTAGLMRSLFATKKLLTHN